MEDASTLRVMKNRESLNLVNLEEGAPAYFPGEIIVERIYAAAHDLSIGDNIKIAGTDYTISGIGTSPDYEYCLQNMSGMSSDGNVFGTAFVTPLKLIMNCLPAEKRFTRKNTVTVIFSGINMTHSELKDYLKNIQINPDEVKDPFFQEMVSRKTKDRDILTDSLQELLPECRSPFREPGSVPTEGKRTSGESRESYGQHLPSGNRKSHGLCKSRG